MFDMKRWMQIMVSLGATIFLLLVIIGCDAPAEEEALEEEIAEEEEEKIYSFEQEDTVRGLSFTPDSRTMVVACGSGTLYVYGSI